MKKSHFLNETGDKIAHAAAKRLKQIVTRRERKIKNSIRCIFI